VELSPEPSLELEFELEELELEELEFSIPSDEELDP
jgi:hypothetical protein